ncbi:dynamin family protein [uncultured Desulfobacter sp.]|uniref:dynamin family protein n=1 Tax=uncultured Desulfobacter sp. TaxID=240139 RepID=UPI0029F4E910|nr:dynamin family protein [uncultured Desulfobacter sp.]
MDRENYMNALREDIVDTITRHLTPVAQRYGYSDMPLETNVKWRPMVLVIGNYSSGKSSLINEFLGAKIQDTGQAPTDDSFTVLTYDDTVPETEGIQVVEQRDGKSLLNDPEYPFSTLRKHGQRFAAHFQLKKINSPFLKNLAIIDTPGMLDSISERDRGYDYQEVLGDLAQKAGLVLVLFDAHKAGTVREAYKSIRETLTTHTFEDRIIFVLNRIDECTTFNDLLRVYGTLCWNLSQITGRKDIPMIRMTYSSNAAAISNSVPPEFLPLLENQREDLKQTILHTPLRRLDHLATYLEIHGERLAHYIEAIQVFGLEFQRFRIQKICIGLLLSLLGGGLIAFALMMLVGMADPTVLSSAGGISAGLIMIVWMAFPQKKLESKFRAARLADLDTLTPITDQTRKDSWGAIRDLVYEHLRANKGDYTLYDLKLDLFNIREINEEATHEIREALSGFRGKSEDDLKEWRKKRSARENDKHDLPWQDVII